MYLLFERDIIFQFLKNEKSALLLVICESPRAFDGKERWCLSSWLILFVSVSRVCYVCSLSRPVSLPPLFLNKEWLWTATVYTPLSIDWQECSVSPDSFTLSVSSLDAGMLGLSSYQRIVREAAGQQEGYSFAFDERRTQWRWTDSGYIWFLFEKKEPCLSLEWFVCRSRLDASSTRVIDERTSTSLCDRELRGSWRCTPSFLVSLESLVVSLLKRLKRETCVIPPAVRVSPSDSLSNLYSWSRCKCPDALSCRSPWEMYMKPDHDDDYRVVFTSNDNHLLWFSFCVGLSHSILSTSFPRSNAILQTPLCFMARKSQDVFSLLNYTLCLFFILFLIFGSFRSRDCFLKFNLSESPKDSHLRDFSFNRHFFAENLWSVCKLMTPSLRPCVSFHVQSSKQSETVVRFIWIVSWSLPTA